MPSDAVPRSCYSTTVRNTVLLVIIWVLGVIDSIARWLFYTWNRVANGPGKAKPSGSNPAPPKVLGIIIAEPNIANVSLRTVADIAAWCLSYDVQQIHLYDPSGHLKQSQPILEDYLQPLAAQEGRTVALKSGWSVAGEMTSLAVPRDLLKHPSTLAAAAPFELITSPAASRHSQQQQLAASVEAININNSNDSSSSSSPALTVRLLSAADAYRPVISAALARCAAAAGPVDITHGGSINQQLQDSQQATANGTSSAFSNHKQRHITSHSSACACEPHSHLTGRFTACITPSLAQDGFSTSCSQNSSCCCSLQQPISRLDLVATATCMDTCVAVGDSSEQLSGSSTQTVCSGSDLQQQHQQACQNGCQLMPAVKPGHDSGPRPSLHIQQQSIAESRLEQQQPLQSQQRQQHSSCQQLLHKQEGSMLPELAKLTDPDILQEPQLLLVFGPVLTLAGYPPFHTRACEIQHMGSLDGASRPLLADAIASYCKVLQRHGA